MGTIVASGKSSADFKLALVVAITSIDKFAHGHPNADCRMSEVKKVRR